MIHTSVGGLAGAGTFTVLSYLAWNPAGSLFENLYEPKRIATSVGAGLLTGIVYTFMTKRYYGKRGLWDQ
jgi:hypothetical protein